MSWIVRYPALYAGTLVAAACAWFISGFAAREPYPHSLVWVAAIAVPAAWTNWLAARLLLQRTGWRVPLRSDRFGFQVGCMAVLTVGPAAYQGILAGLLSPFVVRHAYVPVFLAGCILPLVIQYLVGRKELLVRGRLIRSQWEADLDLHWLRPDHDEGLAWGGLKAPTHNATLHYAIIGATGSGKTLLLRLLKQDAIPKAVRALVYDAKGDELSTLAGLRPSCRVKILHPFDARGVAWDIAADCTTAVAHAIAAVIIPDEGEGPNSFFTKAARHLLAGDLIALMRRAEGVFTFRDVLLIAMNKDLLIQVLGSVEETRHLLDHLKEERTAQSILSTLMVKLAEFVPVAAAWDHATERVSLKQWAEVGGSILVLGNDEAARAPIDAINRVLFRRASELVLARPETPYPDTLFVLDEVREAGKLDNLGSLLTKGRSKGAAVVLGFQDIEGMRAAYGDDRVANELVGQCAHKALLRMESPATAEWAAEVIGQSEWVEEKVTDGGNGRSITYERVKREGVLPSEFLSLPPTNPADGLTGVFLAPGAGAFRATISGKELAKSLKPADPSVPNFVPRPDWQLILRPWCDADAVRLGMKPLVIPAPATPAAPVAPPAAGQKPKKSRLQVVGRPEPQAE